jgi:hypothetical protein
LFIRLFPLSELNSAVIAYLEASGFFLTAMAFEDEAAGQFGRRRRGRCSGQEGGESKDSSAPSLITCFKAS